jgi:uncharacterized protein YegP (UPF0339 family)
MATAKLTGPRVEYKKNKKGELNFRIIGRNGKILIDNKQGYKRKAGLVKNIKALEVFFDQPDINIVEVK